MRVFRSPSLILLGCAALALASCGDDEASRPQSSGQPSPTGQPSPNPGPTAATTGPGESPAVRKRSREPKAGDVGANGTGRSSGGSSPSSDDTEAGGPKNASTDPSGTTGTAPSGKPDRRKSGLKRTLTARERRAYKRRFYTDAKVSCGAVGLEQIVSEVSPKSRRPKDVAKKYARVFYDSFKFRPPTFTIDQTYRGCLAGLTKRR